MKNIKYSTKEEKFITCVMYQLPQDVSLEIWVAYILKAV